MKTLWKIFLKWVTKEYTPKEDYEKNYCKYSKGYRSYK